MIYKDCLIKMYNFIKMMIIKIIMGTAIGVIMELTMEIIMGINNFIIIIILEIQIKLM